MGCDERLNSRSAPRSLALLKRLRCLAVQSALRKASGAPFLATYNRAPTYVEIALLRRRVAPVEPGAKGQPVGGPKQSCATSTSLCLECSVVTIVGSNEGPRN